MVTLKIHFDRNGDYDVTQVGGVYDETGHHVGENEKQVKFVAIGLHGDQKCEVEFADPGFFEDPQRFLVDEQGTICDIRPEPCQETDWIVYLDGVQRSCKSSRRATALVGTITGSSTLTAATVGTASRSDPDPIIQP